MNTPLRVGLLGAGWVSRAHAEGWLAVKDKAQVVAVADIDVSSADTIAALLGAHAFVDYRQLLEREKPDAIDVCVPPHLHVEVVSSAAELGIHILCEKPLACDMEQADRIGEKIRQSGIAYMAAHNSLFYPTVRRAKTYLENRDLGDIRFIRTSEFPVDPAPRHWGPNPMAPVEAEAAGTWRASKSLLQGGALMDGGFHAVYRLLYLASAKPVAVTAMMSRLGKGPRWEKWEAEDTAVVTVQFSDGSLGEAVVSYAFDSARSMLDRLFSIAGSEGELMGNEHTLSLRPAGWEQPATQRLSPLRDRQAWRASIAAEIEHFADALIQGLEPYPTYGHALETLRLVRAAYESVDQRKTVCL